MKKMWIWISLILVSLVCAQQVRASFIDMGGFQIQVEQKEGTGERTAAGTETVTATVTECPPERDAHEECEKQEAMSSVQTETVPVEEGQTGEGVQQTETPEPSLGEWEPFFGEDPVTAAQETEVWPSVQQEEAVGGEIDLMPEESRIGVIVQEDSGQEATQIIQGEPEMGRDAQPEGQEMEREQGSDGERAQGQGRKERKTADGRTGDEKGPPIRFVHKDLARLSDRGDLAVRLEGEQQVCVLSCAVNHRESAYRWEDGCMIPVDTFLQKGMNCLKITVLLPDGQVISMDPWYFSCGVGLAVL